MNRSIIPVGERKKTVQWESPIVLWYFLRQTSEFILWGEITIITQAIKILGSISFVCNRPCAIRMNNNTTRILTQRSLHMDSIHHFTNVLQSKIEVIDFSACPKKRRKSLCRLATSYRSSLFKTMRAQQRPKHCLSIWGSLVNYQTYCHISHIVFWKK